MNLKVFNDFYIVAKHNNSPEETLRYFSINPGYVDMCEHVELSTGDKVKGYGYRADTMGYLEVRALCEDCLKEEQDRKLKYEEEREEIVGFDPALQEKIK